MNGCFKSSEPCWFNNRTNFLRSVNAAMLPFFFHAIPTAYKVLHWHADYSVDPKRCQKMKMYVPFGAVFFRMPKGLLDESGRFPCNLQEIVVNLHDNSLYSISQGGIIKILLAIECS